MRLYYLYQSLFRGFLFSLRCLFSLSLDLYWRNFLGEWVNKNVSKVSKAEAVVVLTHYCTTKKGMSIQNKWEYVEPSRLLVVLPEALATDLGAAVREVDWAIHLRSKRQGTDKLDIVIFSCCKFIANLLLACIDDASKSLNLSHIVVILVDLALILTCQIGCQQCFILILDRLVIACSRLQSLL